MYFILLFHFICLLSSVLSVHLSICRSVPCLIMPKSPSSESFSHRLMNHHHLSQPPYAVPCFGSVWMPDSGSNSSIRRRPDRSPPFPSPPPHQQLLAADATQESVMCICCRCGSLSIPAAVNRNMSRLPSAHATSCAAELGLVSVFCTCSGYMYAGR